MIIIVSIVIVTIIMFIILCNANSVYIKNNPIHTLIGVIVTALIVGIIGGGILGFLIFVFITPKH